jgi:hypothetical protein
MRCVKAGHARSWETSHYANNGGDSVTVTAILAWLSVTSFGTLCAFCTYGLANFLSLVFVLFVLWKIYGRAPGRDKPPRS